MEYTKGKLIEFNIYGTIVIGEIVDSTEKTVIIKTTEDFIKQNIGKEQEISKSHNHHEKTN